MQICSPQNLCKTFQLLTFGCQLCICTIMHLVLPFGNGLVIQFICNIKNYWLWNLVHKSRCVLKWSFIFNWPNNLDNNNFSHFVYSERLRLRTTNVEILRQSLVRGLNWFFSHNATLRLCNMVILKWLDCKSNMWVENNGGTFWSNPPILRRLQKTTFNVLKWEKKISFVVVGSIIQYNGYTTPNAIMISCFGNCTSNSKISPWVAPSHSSLTLFIAMPKTILVTCWKVVAPSMQEF